MFTCFHLSVTNVLPFEHQRKCVSSLTIFEDLWRNVVVLVVVEEGSASPGSYIGEWRKGLHNLAVKSVSGERICITWQL